ncbi:transposase [Arcobacter sp. F155]|uniref:transposase n=1 Tax=Arcobacter sp. F155 TaxID=2044512 RepID=UPI0035C6C244
MKINLVVRTFNHEKIITKSIEKRLQEVITKNFKQQDIQLKDLNIYDKNTLHVVFFISPHTISLSRVVNSLKTSTSRLIKKEFSYQLSSFNNLGKSFWEHEYKLFT